jgi:DNA invertase Pin-like site-specific DNA recombinase
MSSSQQEASPEQQRAALLQLAAKHHARVVAEYLDEGISGIATDRRRGFQQMLEDAKAGKFKLILAWDQDRFSRLDSIDSGEIIAPLRRAGVRLVTCAQGEIDWISFAGRLVFNVQQEGKNQYLVDLSRNSVRGRVAAAKDGKKHGATNYGYDRLMFDEKNRRMCRIHFRHVFRKPKNWTAKLVQSTDVQAVKTVCWMFRAIAYEGYGPQAIADELNRRKIPTAKGASCWRRPVVTRMLGNPVYVGTCVNGQRPTGKFHTMGGPIVVENAHGALIDRKTFDIVQAAIRPKRRLSAAQSGYVLCGLLFCGHCGTPMIAHTASLAKERTRSYICSKHYFRGNITCRHPSIVAERLESFVIQTVNGSLAKESVDKIAEEAKREFACLQNVKLEIRRLEKQLSQLRTQVQRGIQNRSRANAENVSSVSAVVDSWRDELDRRQHDMRVLRGMLPQSDTANVSVHQMAQLWENARGGTPDIVKAALAKVIDRIVIARQSRLHRTYSGTIFFHHGLGLMSMAFSEGDFAPTLYHEVAAAVAALSNGEPVKSSQVKEEIGICMANVYHRLMRAVSAGLLEKVGEGLWRLARAPEGIHGIPTAQDRIRRALASRSHGRPAQEKTKNTASTRCAAPEPRIRPIRKTRTKRRLPVKR